MQRLYIHPLAGQDLALDQCHRLRPDDPHRAADPLCRADRRDVVPHGGAAVHNLVGFVLIANFFVWLVFYLFSDRIKAYHSELNPKKHFIGSLRQIYYYGFGIFSGEPNPFHVEPYRQVQSAAEHDLPDHHDAAAPGPVLYRHPAVGREAVLRAGRFLRRRAGDRHRARADLHRLRLLSCSSTSISARSAIPARRITRR